MSDQSRNVVEALDNIRRSLSAVLPTGSYQFPQIANGPVEEVLAFNNDENISLKNFPKAPYFSSHGPLTDLYGNVLPGSRVETSFPVNLKLIEGATKWPPEQPAPYDRPPRDPKNTEDNGYSKQAYFFGDGSSFVTVGPSLPKIATLESGGAQFWVGSIGVITQGTGKYEGARGVTTYVGSAYLEVWPEDFKEQAKILQAGFKALVGTYAKLVLKGSLAD